MHAEVREIVQRELKSFAEGRGKTSVEGKCRGECWLCGEVSHFHRDCEVWKRWRRDKPDEAKEWLVKRLQEHESNILPAKRSKPGTSATLPSLGNASAPPSTPTQMGRADATAT
jgi:hypothetical protein